ncbi:GntR family transcriptional regulator [Gemmiger formicilis]|uniref:GntR family transcriptional regulator n=1 Tax=Gemmiger formicilis TaxID=745368 RepID=UPI0031F615F4
MSLEQQTKAPAMLGGALISARVVDRLLEEMAHGAYAGLDRLPPELELAARLGVSRTVVRDALSELERGGYLERVRGIGTVVNRDVVHLAHRMDQKMEFHKMIEAMGHIPHTDHLLVTRQTADEDLTRALGLQPGETVLVVGKRMLADDIPVLFCTDVMPLSLFGGRLDGIDFSRPVFDVLQDHCDIQTTSTVARLHAVPGETAVRRLLGLGPDKALLELEETCYSRLCRPVVRSRTLYTDFFDFALVRKLV